MTREVILMTEMAESGTIVLILIIMEPECEPRALSFSTIKSAHAAAVLEIEDRSVDYLSFIQEDEVFCGLYANAKSVSEKFEVWQEWVNNVYEFSASVVNFSLVEQVID
jgi:hypothetical protein